MTTFMFDDIIVGAGSSGAALAARLSEDPERKVLLLEAGPDYPSLQATPRDLLGPDVSLSDHDWNLRAGSVGGRPNPFPRGKVVGGSSAVNGAVALRGVPADYDEWARLGNGEWAWNRVLPYFKRLEDDELGETGVQARAVRFRFAGSRSRSFVPPSSRPIGPSCPSDFPKSPITTSRVRRAWVPFRLT